jgi:hypothetical protein
MFAAIDITTLIGLLIFIVFAIVSALVKKKEEPFELPPELKPRGDRPKPPVRSWEEELRRVLEQSAAPAPPPIVQHAPAPPSPLRVPPPAPAGVPPPGPLRGPPMAPPLAPPPRPVVEHGWDEGRIEVTLPTLQQHVAPTFHPPRGLVDSDVRYAHASHLQERVAAHMGDVTRHRVGTTLVQRTAATMEATDAAQTLRTRRGVRTALIASIILGPPRAVEGWHASRGEA